MPPAVQPKPEDYSYDLDGALAAIGGAAAIARRCLHRRDARHRTRRQRRHHRRRRGADDRLPDHRSRDDLADPRRRPRRPGHVLGLRPGDRLRPGASAGARRPAGAPARRFGGRGRRTRWWSAAPADASHSVAAAIVAKQEFAGYWEYVLDEAIFTAPAHPFWGGTALIGPAGDLLGIGSLQVQQGRGWNGRAAQHDRPDRSAEADPGRLLTIGRRQSAAAPLARLLRNRDRRHDRGRGSSDRRAGATAPICAPATSCSPSPATRSAISPASSAASGRWAGRRRGAAHGLSRWQNHRGARDLRRPRPLPQGPESALNRRSPTSKR